MFLQSQKLILGEYDLIEHSIPERRSITHRSEAQGEIEVLLYAHD